MSVRRSVGRLVGRSVTPSHFRRFRRASEHRVASIGSCYVSAKPSSFFCAFSLHFYGKPFCGSPDIIDGWQIRVSNWERRGRMRRRRGGWQQSLSEAGSGRSEADLGLTEVGSSPSEVCPAPSVTGSGFTETGSCV